MVYKESYDIIVAKEIKPKMRALAKKLDTFYKSLGLSDYKITLVPYNRGYELKLRLSEKDRHLWLPQGNLVYVYPEAFFDEHIEEGREFGGKITGRGPYVHGMGNYQEQWIKSPSQIKPAIGKIFVGFNKDFLKYKKDILKDMTLYKK